MLWCLIYFCQGETLFWHYWYGLCWPEVSRKINRRFYSCIVLRSIVQYYNVLKKVLYKDIKLWFHKEMDYFNIFGNIHNGKFQLLFFSISKECWEELQHPEHSEGVAVSNLHPPWQPRRQVLRNSRGLADISCITRCLLRNKNSPTHLASQPSQASLSSHLCGGLSDLKLA